MPKNIKPRRRFEIMLPGDHLLWSLPPRSRAGYARALLDLGLLAERTLAGIEETLGRVLVALEAKACALDAGSEPSGPRPDSVGEPGAAGGEGGRAAGRGRGGRGLVPGGVRQAGERRRLVSASHSVLECERKFAQQSGCVSANLCEGSP